MKIEIRFVAVAGWLFWFASKTKMVSEALQHGLWTHQPLTRSCLQMQMKTVTELCIHSSPSHLAQYFDCQTVSSFDWLCCQLPFQHTPAFHNSLAVNPSTSPTFTIFSPYFQNKKYCRSRQIISPVSRTLYTVSSQTKTLTANLLDDVNTKRGHIPLSDSKTIAMKGVVFCGISEMTSV